MAIFKMGDRVRIKESSGSDYAKLGAIGVVIENDSNEPYITFDEPTGSSCGSSMDPGWLENHMDAVSQRRLELMSNATLSPVIHELPPVAAAPPSHDFDCLYKALIAIKARISGEFDNPELMAYGSLTADPDIDILFIAERAIGKLPGAW